VTTLPAKAGNFLRRSLPQQELLRLRLTHPPPLLPEGSIQAHWSGPCRPEGAAPLPVFLPSRGKVLHAIPTAEHRKEPRLPSTRDMSYPRAFPAEPPEHTVRVEVPSYRATARVACQIAPASSADAPFPSGLQAGVPWRFFHGTSCCAPVS
jgi:hypothetical protein